MEKSKVNSETQNSNLDLNLVLGSNPQLNNTGTGAHNHNAQKYLPAAANASMNLSLSNLNESSVGSSGADMVKTKAASIEYENRIVSVFQTRYKRGLEHLSEFMRIQVSLTLKSNADPQGKICQFPILIGRMKSINDLAQHVEAEYAFMHMHESLSASNYDPDLLINSVQVVTIYDVGNIPLKFASPIAEVLNNGDKVHVIGSVTDKKRMKDLTSTRLQLLQNFFKSSELDSQQTIASWSNEAKLFALLHNLPGISAFQDYCMQEFEIENLLFWLEVEVFRGLCRQATSDIYATSINMSNPLYPRLLLHTRYIYYTFLATNSSLRLNVPSELLETIDWPLPRLDAITGLHLPLRIGIWDDIQEHVFLYLSLFVYPRFEKSASYSDWKDVLQMKFTGINTDNGYFYPGDHHLNFQQDVDGMEKAVKEFLAANPSSQNNMLSVINNSQENLSTLRTKSRSRAESVHTNHGKIGTRSGSVSFLEKDLVTLPPEYYGQGPRITNAQRLRRIQREKKLKKFFGDAPIQKDDFADVGSAQFGVSSYNLLQDDSDCSVSPFRDSSASSTVEPSPSNPETSKKKRADKLGEFFGVRLPEEQLFEQRLVDRLERIRHDSETELIVTISTRNELDSQTKQKLLMKKKKLKGMLGDAADEDIAKHAIGNLEVGNSPQALRKGLSTGSVNSDESVTSSLATVTEHARKTRDEKEYKRKKLDKIHQFLGEKVTTKMLDKLKSEQEAKQQPEVSQFVSPGSRQPYIRRLNKLQSVFGEVPPTLAVTQGPIADLKSSGSVMSLLGALGGEAVVSYLFSHEAEMRELLQVMEDFDRTEKPYLPSHLENADIRETTEEADSEEEEQKPSFNDDEVDQGKLVKKVEHARQRRRIGKLTRFFGSPAGAISTELSMEERVLEDVARHFKQLMDPMLLKQLGKLAPDQDLKEDLSSSSPAAKDIAAGYQASANSSGKSLFKNESRQSTAMEIPDESIEFSNE